MVGLPKEIRNERELEILRVIVSPAVMNKRDELLPSDYLDEDDGGHHDDHDDGDSSESDSDGDDGNDDGNDDGGNDHPHTQTGFPAATQTQTLAGGNSPSLPSPTADVASNPLGPDSSSPTPWSTSNSPSPSGSDSETASSTPSQSSLNTSQKHTKITPASIGGICFGVLILLLIVFGCSTCIRRKMRRKRVKEIFEH